jgi:hypothetical protein
MANHQMVDTEVHPSGCEGQLMKIISSADAKMADEAFEIVETATSIMSELFGLHTANGLRCRECNHVWPCKTVQVLRRIAEAPCG